MFISFIYLRLINITMYNLFVAVIVPLSVLIPIISAVYNYKYLTRPYKIILSFIVFSSLLNLVNLIAIYIFRLQTTSIFHIYTVFEFVFISAYFGEFYNRQKKTIIYVTAGVFVLFCLINTIFLQHPGILNTYARSVGAILIIVYSMLYFLKFGNNDEETWTDIGFNWICSALLIYYASCLFMFIFSNYLLTASKTVVMIVWGGHDTILMLEYILFAVGFYKCRSQPIISTY